MKAFYVEISTGPVLLTADNVWPDGDGPDNPTAEDVEELIHEMAGRDLLGLAKDWFLDDNVDVAVYEGPAT